MTKAQVIFEQGPPEVMHWQDWPVPPPSANEVRIRHTAIGVNFADTYHRAGISHPWPVPPRPCVAAALRGRRFGRRDHSGRSEILMVADIGRTFKICRISTIRCCCAA